jgi:hypothetical protein
MEGLPVKRGAAFRGGLFCCNDTKEPVMSQSQTIRLLCVADCRVGMKVRHVMTVGKSRGAGDGEIMAIGPDGVLVHYSTGINGLYDDRWFQITGVILEHVIEEQQRAL